MLLCVFYIEIISGQYVTDRKQEYLEVYIGKTEKSFSPTIRKPNHITDIIYLFFLYIEPHCCVKLDFDMVSTFEWLQLCLNCSALRDRILSVLGQDSHIIGVWKFWWPGENNVYGLTISYGCPFSFYLIECSQKCEWHTPRH